MKKIIFLLVIIIITLSCNPTLEDNKIANPEEITTIEIQNNIIDSCAVIATDGMYYYIMNDNLVEYKFQPINNDLVLIDSFFIFFMILVIIILIVVLIKSKHQT